MPILSQHQDDNLRREFELTWRKVATSYGLSAQLIESAEIIEYFDPMTDYLSVTLCTYVLTDNLECPTVTREAEVPETWWQHTKLVHFPTFSRWLRRPPRMRTIRLSVDVAVDVLFPQAVVNFPKELGKPVRIISHTVDWRP